MRWWPWGRRVSETEFLARVIEITTYGQGLNLQPPKPRTKDPVERTLSLIANTAKTGDDTHTSSTSTLPELQAQRSRKASG